MIAHMPQQQQRLAHKTQQRLSHSQRFSSLLTTARMVRRGLLAPSLPKVAMQSIMDISSSSDEEEFMEDMIEIIALLAVVVATEDDHEQRNFKWNNTRLNWEDYVDKLAENNEFDQTYRMSIDSFDTLVEILGFSDDVFTSHNSTTTPISEEIYPELIAHIGLLWLAGGAVEDICDASGLSQPSVERCIDLFIDAVLDAEELAIKFPKTNEEITDAAARFSAKSTHGVMAGCVGCVDGIFIRIQPPEDVEHAWAYRNRSGHYCSMGFNVQAVCDDRLRFTYMAIASSGKTPDIDAYSAIKLRGLVEALPMGFYVIGDPAYIPTEHMLTPFSGSQQKDEDSSIFNAYHSQLRIRIEMALGQLTTTWRILRSPLTMNLEKASKVIECCMRLSNFCITEDTEDTTFEGEVECCPVDGLPVLDEDASTMSDREGLGYLPTVPDYSFWLELTNIQGPSLLRDAIRRKIIDNGYERPIHNIARARASPNIE